MLCVNTDLDSLSNLNLSDPTLNQQFTVVLSETIDALEDIDQPISPEPAFLDQLKEAKENGILHSTLYLNNHIPGDRTLSVGIGAEVSKKEVDAHYAKLAMEFSSVDELDLYEGLIKFRIALIMTRSKAQAICLYPCKAYGSNLSTEEREKQEQAINLYKDELAERDKASKQTQVQRVFKRLTESVAEKLPKPCSSSWCKHTNQNSKSFNGIRMLCYLCTQYRRFDLARDNDKSLANKKARVAADKGSQSTVTPTRSSDRIKEAAEKGKKVTSYAGASASSKLSFSSTPVSGKRKRTKSVEKNVPKGCESMLSIMERDSSTPGDISEVSDDDAINKRVEEGLALEESYEMSAYESDSISSMHENKKNGLLGDEAISIVAVYLFEAVCKYAHSDLCPFDEAWFKHEFLRK